MAAFAFFGGIVQRIWYDNLKTASQEILRGRTVKEQQMFLAFRSHYLFASSFCNVGEAHEKGQVEHAVGFSRRNFLVPIPTVASYDELNALLRAQCQQDNDRTVKGQSQTIRAAWEQEVPHMRSVPPHAFACCVTVQARLTPYSQVIYETNRYSVPTDRAATTMTVQAYPFHVDIVHEQTVIATHARCYERDQDIFNPMHYLPLLERRPRGFDHAKPIQEWRQHWPPCYLRLLARLRLDHPDGKGIREFVSILRLHETFSTDLLTQAIEHAFDLGCPHLEGIRLCLHHLLHPETPPPALDLGSRPHLDGIGETPISLSSYDTLLEGVPA